MNIDDRPTTNDQRPTDLRANSHILGKFQMAITLQRINRSPSCLVLGWGFRGRRIQRRHFRLDEIQDGGRRPSLKTSDGHISATRHPTVYRERTNKQILRNSRENHAQGVHIRLVTI